MGKLPSLSHSFSEKCLRCRLYSKDCLFLEISIRNFYLFTFLLVSKKNSRSSNLKALHSKVKLITKKPQAIKSEKLARTKKRARRFGSVVGRRIVMEIGTSTVLAEFLDKKDRLTLNLLCRHIYRVVMPSISCKLLINSPREW